MKVASLYDDNGGDKLLLLGERASVVPQIKIVREAIKNLPHAPDNIIG